MYKKRSILSNEVSFYALCYPVQLLERLDLHKLLLVVSGVGNALEIPRYLVPCLKARKPLAVLLGVHFRLPYGKVDAVTKRRQRRHVPKQHV